jgi:hypothetical protein
MSPVSSLSTPPPPLPGVSDHMPVVSLVLVHDLPTQINKNFIDVRSSSRGSFIIRHIPPVLGDLEGAWSWYRAILLEVRLVSYEDHRHVVIFLYSSYLLSQLSEFEQ